MKKIKYFLFFLLFFSLGITTRYFFLSFYQLPEGKQYFQDYPLISDQGGSETPELAWQNYLNALRNGDIETALKQVWPHERERLRDVFQRLKEVNYLDEFVENIQEIGWRRISEKEYEINIKTLITNETQYAHSGNWNLIIEKWNGPSEGSYQIKLNPYNKKWYVVYYGDQF